ncbi:MAG: 2-oxoglutarate dehydrogenase E1 component, partial [Marinilabiliales bacterium]
VDIKEVRRVVFCSGKIYYDLLAKKEEFDAKDIALIRVEQLYPWPEKQIQTIIKKYHNTRRWIWAQEEPENMGAWRFIKEKLTTVNLQVVARLASGSPAVGLNKLHVLGQNEIIGKIFRKCTCELKNKYCGLQCEKGSAREEINKQHTYLYL